MMHRVRGRRWPTVVWMIGLVLSLVWGPQIELAADVLPATRSVQPHRQVLVPKWTNGMTVFAPAEVPETPGPVTVVAQRVVQTAEFARASRLARVPVEPTTMLMQSPWGDSYWNPVTDIIEYRPFNRPTLMFYIGAVRSAAGGTAASYQAALNAAVNHDIVQIDADTTIAPAEQAIYPNRGDAGYVLVRTAEYASLPAQGTKPSEASFSTFKKLNLLRVPGGYHRFAQSARGWHLRGVRMLNTAANTYDNSGLLTMEASPQTATSQMPTYIIVEQCLIDGAGKGCRRCIQLGCEYFYIIDSQVIKAWGAESHAIGGWNAIGKGLVDGNTLDGHTEGAALLGGASTGMGSHEYQADIQFRRSYCVRPLTNMGSGSGLTGMKNFFETKNSNRVVFEAAVCANHDVRGQPANFNIGPKPQNTNEQAWVRVHDMLVRHTYVSNGAGPGGMGNSCSDCKRDAQGVCIPGTTYCAGANGCSRTEFLNNLSFAPFSVSFTYIFQQGSTNNSILQGTMRHNTWHSGASSMVQLASAGGNLNNVPGLRHEDNVWFRTGTINAYAAYQSGANGTQQLAGYNDTILNWNCGAGNWSVKSNLTNQPSKTQTALWGTVLTDTLNYPWKNKSLLKQSMVFQKDQGGAADDYTIAEQGIYQTMSTTGGRPGVNMTRLNAAISGVAV